MTSLYVHTDVPPGMTLDQYRRTRPKRERPHSVLRKGSVRKFLATRRWAIQ